MSSAPWRRLHPLTRLVLFGAVCLCAAAETGFVPLGILAGALLLLVIAAGTLRSRWAMLLWLHVFSLPGLALVFVLAGHEDARTWPAAVAWGLPEAARYALRLECLLLANLALIGTTTMLEISRLFAHRRVPAPAGLLLSTAVRFVPMSIAEARRIYDIQRCRGLRVRPWAPRTWLPIAVPLFVAQMCRAHETAVMLAVRRILRDPRPGFDPPVTTLDGIAIGVAVAVCGSAFLWRLG